MRLVDATREVGLDFTHRTGAEGMKHLPETMGAGLAWTDFDGDGWLDLYLVQSSAADGGDATNRLFRNLGGHGFEDVTASSGSGHAGYGQGVLAADLDGDGFADLMVTNFGEDVLLLNIGTGAYEEQVGAFPADATAETPGWSSSAAAGDGDGDGDLDLYVSQYVDFDPTAPLFCGDPESGERRYCDPSLFEGSRDLYFRNLGDGGWEERGIESGLGSADGRGLGVVFVDLDDDHRPDLYVANDLTPNLLFRNLGDGSFEDVSLFSGSAVDRHGKPEAGMGVAVADLDGDSRPDLLVTNFDVETNTHYANQGGLAFVDTSATSGVGPPSFNYLAFGIGVADFNGDGELDIYSANGHIFERPKRDNTDYRQRDQVLVGDGQGRFEEARCVGLDERRTVARGLATSDFDNDGDVDLAVQENGGPAGMLRNDASPAHWLGVRLTAPSPNTEAVGARITLTSDRGLHQRWILAGDSYQSSSDRRALFSLAPGERVERVSVVWPSGARWSLASPPIDRYLTVTRTP